MLINRIQALPRKSKRDQQYTCNQRETDQQPTRIHMQLMRIYLQLTRKKYNGEKNPQDTQSILRILSKTLTGDYPIPSRDPHLRKHRKQENHLNLSPIPILLKYTTFSRFNRFLCFFKGTPRLPQGIRTAFIVCKDNLPLDK